MSQWSTVTLHSTAKSAIYKTKVVTRTSQGYRDLTAMVPEVTPPEEVMHMCQCQLEDTMKDVKDAPKTQLRETDGGLALFSDSLSGWY